MTALAAPALTRAGSTAAPPLAKPRATFPDVLERVFAGAVLLLLSEALLGPLFNPLQLEDGAPWLRQIWLPVYGLIALAAVTRLPSMARTAWAAALLVPLLLLALLSAGWSIAPDLSFRRAVALSFVGVFSLYLAARFSWRELLNLLAAVFLVLAVGSYVSVLVSPAWAIHSTIHPGAWKGLWFEKNGLGQIMTWGVLACAVAAVLTPERRRLWIGAAVLCAGLVLCSTSKTSLLGVLLAGGALTALAGVRRGGVLSVATFWLGLVTAVVALGLAVLAPEVVLDALGKDPTLTGRTDIWSAVMRRVAERPWQGYGYAAFWAVEEGPVGFVRNEVDWNAPTAHNGWLELLLSFGWTGVMLFAPHLMVTACAAVIALRRGPEVYWAVPAVALFALFSLSESTIMQQNNLIWALYVATSAKLLLRPERDA